MTDLADSSGIEYDHEVVVDSVDAVTPVPIDCPGCGESFREALSDKLDGTTCHGCNDWIRYVRRSELRDRGERTEDKTEQTRLVTDGGVDRPPVVFANAGTNNECLGCGGHVQPGTVRVYGTNDGRLFACPACSTPRDLRQGAGKDPDYDPDVDRGKSTASGYHPIFGGDGQ